MRRKRRSRSYRNPQRRDAKLNFAPVIIVLCLSVGCGYAAAKYVVDPVVNYVPQIMAEKKQEEAAVNTETQASVVEGDVTVEETAEVAGYALQFGCYSSSSAAEGAMGDVGVEGLQILEQNGMYKIIGATYDTKEKAKEALESLPDTVNAFVTTIYK